MMALKILLKSMNDIIAITARSCCLNMLSPKIEQYTYGDHVSNKRNIPMI